MKWRNWPSKFGVYDCVNCLLRQKSSKLHHLWFNFRSKTFTVYLKHINNYDFAKISKSKKNDPHRYFQPYLHLRSCTEASHFDRMDLIFCSKSMQSDLKTPRTFLKISIFTLCEERCAIIGSFSFKKVSVVKEQTYNFFRPYNKNNLLSRLIKATIPPDNSLEHLYLNNNKIIIKVGQSPVDKRNTIDNVWIE